MKSCRELVDLEWARLVDPPSLYKKPPKLKGVKAKGRTYERTVGRRLKDRCASGELPAQLVSGQWFNFCDANGYGYCQTDYYLICEGFIILLECKLTQTDFAETQMRKLYEPILRKVYGLPVVVVQVFKNIRYHPAAQIKDILDAIEYPRPETLSWHFLP